MTPSPAEMRALIAAATPGPWRVDERAPSVVTPHEPGGKFDIIGTFNYRHFGSDRRDSDNAALIVALRNAAPSLLDSLDAAKVERDEAWSMLALVATKSSLLCAWHAHYGVFSKNPHVIHADLCSCDVEVKQLRAKATLRAALVAPATGRE